MDHHRGRFTGFGTVAPSGSATRSLSGCAAGSEICAIVSASLGRYAIDSQPDWEHAGGRAIQELSLLRQQMKLDIDIYGVSYFGELDDEDDKAFLRKAGIDPRRWARPPWRRRLATAAQRILDAEARRPAAAAGGPATSAGADVDSTPSRP